MGGRQKNPPSSIPATQLFLAPLGKGPFQSLVAKIVVWGLMLKSTSFSKHALILFCWNVASHSFEMCFCSNVIYNQDVLILFLPNQDDSCIDDLRRFETPGFLKRGRWLLYTMIAAASVEYMVERIWSNHKNIRRSILIVLMFWVVFWDVNNNTPKGTVLFFPKNNPKGYLVVFVVVWGVKC